jgi:hypothetical protein
VQPLVNHQYTAIVPSLGGKPAQMQRDPSGRLWMVNFGSGGSPNKPYGIECYSLATPGAPARISYTGSPTFSWFNVEQIRFSTPNILVAIANGPAAGFGIHTVDITNPTAPTNITPPAGILFPTPTVGAYDMALSPNGLTAFVANQTNGLLAYDLTVAATPTLISTSLGNFVSVDTTMFPIVAACDITLGQIRFYDYTVLTAPVLLSSLPLSTAIRRMAVDPATKTVFVATTSATTGAQIIYVVNAATIAAPTIITTFPSNVFGDDTPIRFFVNSHGQKILSVPSNGQDASPGTVTFFNVTNPASPKTLDIFEGSHIPFDCILVGTYAYVADRGGAQSLRAFVTTVA